MHAARAAALLGALGGAIAARPARGDASWRDQWIFLGDDGAVVALVLQRRDSGAAEVKGWIGERGRWRGELYETFALDGAAPSDAAAVVRAWEAASRHPLRASLEADGARLRLDARAPGFVVRLSAGAAAPLAETGDPEGASRYAWARGHLALGRRERAGIVITETTPADRPRRAHVEYGDFAFVVARVGQRTIVAKQSTAARFNRIITASSGASVGGALAVAVGRDEIRVSGASPPDLAVLAVLDRRVSAGVGLDESPRRHEVWLLGGDGAGVAFRIIPEAKR